MKTLPVILLVVNGTVWRNPNNEVVPTNRTDSEGRILYAPKTQIIKPGEKFQSDDPEEVRRLLEAGAVEVLDEGWDEVIEAAEQVRRAERGLARPSEGHKFEAWPRPRYGSQTEISSRDSAADDLF